MTAAQAEQEVTGVNGGAKIGDRQPAAMGAHPPRRFWLEMAAVLAAKAIALTALYLCFFSTPADVPDAPAHLFHSGSAP
jgi:hypothetical protein